MLCYKSYFVLLLNMNQEIEKKRMIQKLESVNFGDVVDQVVYVSLTLKPILS